MIFLERSTALFRKGWQQKPSLFAWQWSRQENHDPEPLRRAMPSSGVVTNDIWVFPKIGVFPPKWMDKIMENPIIRWKIWGYHYFRKHPYRILEICLFLAACVFMFVLCCIVFFECIDSCTRLLIHSISWFSNLKNRSSPTRLATLPPLKSKKIENIERAETTYTV